MNTRTIKVTLTALVVVVLASAVAAIAGLATRVSASGSRPRSYSPVREFATPTAAQQSVAAAAQDAGGSGKISAETIKALGIRRLPKGLSSKDVAKALSKRISRGNPDAADQLRPQLTGPSNAFAVVPPHGGKTAPQPNAGQPAVLSEISALSAAFITTVGGRDTQFSEVALVADWDGREDGAADRAAKIDDFSSAESDIDFSLTRAAVSEHTVANGHLFNSYYYGDSVGNFYFGFDLTGDPHVDSVIAVNLPGLVNTGADAGFTLLNPTPADCVDDQVTVTGIAVNPVADLGDFDPTLCGVTGEVVYVSVLDTEGCAANAANQPIRTRIFEFAVFEVGGTEFVAPQVRQILRSKFSNVAGIAVDDDGSLYYQLVDLIQFTGGAIFKATEICRPVGACGTRINRVINLIPDPPTLNSWSGTASTPVVTANGVRNTNYGRGSSPLYGNIVSLATGQANTLYAAVARSFVSSDDDFAQATEGLFPAPSAFTNGTPSMIVSFADCSGAFELCSNPGAVISFSIPEADGFADAAALGQSVIPGVNNFRIFALGAGPDLRPAAGGTSIVPNTPASVLRVGMQIDYTLHSGIAVTEEGSVFVISGGTPAGIGTNPSPGFTEVLGFEDGCPADRRADFVDLRGDGLPNPPQDGGSGGDGDSDRFDHIFCHAPIDQITLTPSGLGGLARGFLRYTNRQAPTPLGPGISLGFNGMGGVPVLSDDGTTEGPIVYENLDPGHQVAGGDDQNPPFTGDDSDGAGSPTLPDPLNGGFEFVFGGTGVTSTCVWNGFFWNSNGNITFAAGDTDDTPTVPEFRSNRAKIAPAWCDLNPSARTANLCSFPVMALGFANVNAFKIRWINVPQFGSEGCTGTSVSPGNASNTFSITLYDDGTGIDENANQPLNPANPIGNNSSGEGVVAFDLQEGPTALRFTREPNTGTIVGCPPRREGSGNFVFDYGRMHLIGTAGRPVITGYSIGGLNGLNPPGLCETNLSEAARGAESTFGVLVGSQTAAISCSCLIGEGTEPTIFELFDEGRLASIGSGGEITEATPDFDLRFEGNDAATCTQARQRDLNRGRLAFFGIGCAPPSNPQCLAVIPSPFAVTPTTTGLVNALCAVQLNLVGCGFFPNEVTTICQGFQSETGVPLQRPGKTVSTAATLACDTNGDGIPESVVALTSVTPVSCNLVKATIPVSATFGPNSTSGFPSACCGGPATVATTTSFSAGDNNVFGPFTRTTVCSLNLGVRAPVVISASPSSGNCAVGQDVLITGACFSFTTPNPLAGQPGQPATITGTVTSVFALERTNTANRVNANPFVIVNPNLIDAFFQFGSANAGKTFLIFVQGTGGTSRNLTTLPAGAPAGCALGNEQGVQVTFTCNAVVLPPVDAPEGPIVNGCKLNRDPSGRFTLDVTGHGFKQGASVTVGGVAPKKIKFVDLEEGSTTRYKKITLIKRFCRGLPGNIVVTNPSDAFASTPLFCNESCPTN